MSKIVCPECKKKQLALCQDAILVFPLSISEDDEITAGDKISHENLLDNMWLECNACGATSEDSEILEKMFDSIF
jgi:hypothetical protein